ncbi:MAG: hypothetical protein K2N43_09065 [Lachnospiraceae bacterium]|nr:hypothetical protein [Lachnospiraceae bacterium]MDE7248024.1 hypothetical protein [Lachnospiraceae bacterium]
MMMTADNEKDFVTLSEALKLIGEKERQKISVPCNIGDRLYSIIGEKVSDYVITGFRIEKDKIYMESQESMLFPEDKIGTYYFWSHDLAEREFDKKRRGRIDRNNGKRTVK